MTTHRARTVGRIVQGTVLGVLFFFAILKVLSAASGGAIFRYQGF